MESLSLNGIGRASPFAPTERHRFAVVAVCALGVALLLALHYTATLHLLGLHDALRRLFYLPVIVAAIAAGSRGGLGIAAFAGLGFLPHLRQLATAGDRVMDSAVELVLLLLVGGLVGWYADASRRARAQAAERGRFAALGEMGLALVAQTQGPLAAIEGQALSLSALSESGGRGGISFAAEVIREEAARARHLLGDIGEIASVTEQRRDRIELSPLIERILTDVRNAREDGGRAIFVDRPRSCIVASNKRALAFSLRTLVYGLLDSVARPGWVELRLAGLPVVDPTLEVSVFTLGEKLPDLEESLTRVFGAGAGEYRFQQVLCIRLLALLGASVKFQRVSACHSRILIRFPAPGADAPDRKDAATRGTKGGSMKRSALVAGGVLILGALTVGGCAASTRLRGSWSELTRGNETLRHVMIVQVATKGEARRIFEDRFAVALKARGIDGESSYALLGDGELDSTRVDLEIHKGHCDGIFVSRLVDDKIVRHYYQPAGGFTGSRGQSWSAWARNHPQVTEGRVLVMETRLYRISDDRLIWSGVTQSEFPKAAAPEKQIDPMVRQLVRGLERSGVALQVDARSGPASH